MKKNLVFIVFFLVNILAVSAQTSKSVAKGSITVSTGQKMQFLNLRFQDDMVVFINTATNSEFTYFLKTVRLIEDADKNVVYKQAGITAATMDGDNKQIAIQAASATIPAKKPEKLVFKNCDRILLDEKKLKPDETRDILKVNTEALRNYNSGRTLNNIGDIAIGVGAGMIAGGGISNINQANKANKAHKEMNYGWESESKGSPGIIIAGIVVGLASIPLKIVGHSKVKEAISDYNREAGIAGNLVKYEVFAVAKGNGMALVIKW